MCIRGHCVQCVRENTEVLYVAKKCFNTCTIFSMKKMKIMQSIKMVWIYRVKKNLSAF